MISFIVPSIGRPSLAQALASIDCDPGDEILVIGTLPDTISDVRVNHIACRPGGNWGCLERTLGIEAATQPYLAFLDDDDEYLPEARWLMRDAIATTPDRPVLFRMVYPSGRTLWKDPVLRIGNVSSQMILIPNDRQKLGRWTGRREGDYDFLHDMRWRPKDIVWRSDVIASLGHNDEGEARAS